MSVGVRAYWLPLSAGGRSDQITKNSGYLSIILQGVHYVPEINRWRRYLRPTERVAITSRLVIGYGSEKIESMTLQEFRSIVATKSYFLGVGRHIGVKLPASADDIEISVEIATVRSDELDRALHALKGDSFRKPLDLTAPVVSQAITIAQLVKSFINQADCSNLVKLSYPALLSSDPVSAPVDTGRLAAGHLLIVASERENVLDTLNGTALRVSGDSVVTSDGKQLDATYALIRIVFDKIRGDSSLAEWSVRFRRATAIYDGVISAPKETRRRLFRDSMRIWREACTLLDSDPTYIDAERLALKRTFLSEIHTRANSVADGDDTAVDVEIAVLDLVEDAMAIEGEEPAELLHAARDYRQSLRLLGLGFDGEG